MQSRKASLYWLYLRGYALVTGSVTLLCVYLTWLRGPAGFGIVILVKLVLAVLLFWRHRNAKQKEIYFYLNNGIGLRELILVGLGTDLTAWIILSALTLQLFW